jgi:hypothetical protein
MREFDIQLNCSIIRVAQIAGMCQPVSESGHLGRVNRSCNRRAVEFLQFLSQYRLVSSLPLSLCRGTVIAHEMQLSFLADSVPYQERAYWVGSSLHVTVPDNRCFDPGISALSSSLRVHFPNDCA